MIWTDKDNFFDRIKDEKKFGIFLDMGVGKTSLLLALADHKFFSGIKKILIITPKKVSLSTWQNEIKKWKNFNYMTSLVSLLDGNEKTREKKLTDINEYCIHIISSALVEWLYGKKTRKGKQIIRPRNQFTPNYDMIIVDECSQFKDPTTNRFKALKRLAEGKEIFLLSGTPFSNITSDGYGNYIKADELYYIFYLLGLYVKSLTQFRNEFCFTLPWDLFNYRMTKIIYNGLISNLAKHCIRKKLDIPIQMNEYKVYCRIDKERLKTLKNEYYVVTDGLTNINAANKAIMINKTLQLSNGFVYNNIEAKRMNEYKYQRLLELLNTIEDNVIIFYNYKEDKRFLLENLPNSRAYEKNIDQDDWNDGKIKHFILSPFSEKHGLNLQQGGHTIIWFGLVWSAESYEQANARLYRTGQEHDVNIYYLLAENGFDDYVYDTLVKKTHTIDGFISCFGET